MRERLGLRVAFPPPSPDADRQRVEWQSENASFTWRGHTSGPVGEGRLFLVKKPETRAIAFFFFF